MDIYLVTFAVKSRRWLTGVLKTGTNVASVSVSFVSSEAIFNKLLSFLLSSFPSLWHYSIED